MDARVLADVERVQMKAEGADLQNERIDEGAGDAQSAIGGSEARKVSRSSRNSSTEQ